jgi:hypothetical protein
MFTVNKPCSGRALFAGFLALACQYGAAMAAQPTQQTTDLTGIWQITSYSPQLLPMNGGSIPFTPAGLASYQKTQQQLKQDSAVDVARSTCVPEGVPRSLASPYPFDIVQSPSQVILLHEVSRAVRIVPMQDKHNDPGLWDPSYMGDGIGHWDRGVLVIDATNFNDLTWLDDSGLPHSDQLHTVERLRTLKAGQQLEDVLTIEDPATFTRPWSVRFLFERRPNLIFAADWVCGEPHRDISSVPGAGNYR